MPWSTFKLAGDAPRWFEIADVLRSAIDNGEFPPGATLPTEHEINSVFQVSRTTSRAAMNRLVQEGRIARRPGVGSIVLETRVDQPVTRLSGFTEDMLRRGLQPTFDVLNAGMGLAPREVSQALGIASGDKPFMSERLFRANGRLIGHAVSWIRPDIFRDVAPPATDALARGSLYAWLAENLHVEITGGVEHIEAALVPEELEGKLQLQRGEPILVARRTARSQRDLPVEYAVVSYRADRYRFRIEL